VVRMSGTQVQWHHGTGILHDLSNAIIAIVEQLQAQSKLKPQVERIFVCEARQLTYNPAGIPKAEFQFRRTGRRNWGSLIHGVTQLVESTEVYTQAVDVCRELCGEHTLSENAFQQYVATLVSKALRARTPHTRKSSVIQAQSVFIDTLKRRTPILRASVKLLGISVPKTGVSMKSGRLAVRLRRPTARDLRREVSEIDAAGQAMMNLGGSYSTYPSTVATLSLRSRLLGELQTAVDETIRTLRLFGTGSVGHISYTMSPINASSSLGTATLFPGVVFKGPEHLAITPLLVKTLKQF